jgi:hypothetical protein
MDQKTLAYINMYAILGTLENLCELDPEARALLSNKKPLSLCFDVKGGPKGTLTFVDGKIRMLAGAHNCDIKIPVSSCEKFNAIIDGKATPIPVKGFSHINFLLKDFTALTDLLTKYLRASEEDLADPVFFARSTELMLYVISVAISQIGDYDEIGQFSAHLIPDGDVSFSIKNGPAATIHCKDHVLSTEKRRPLEPRAIMEFETLELARALFDGKVNALACIGNGSISMRGMINMIDNLNRILDRVALYLA